MKKLVLIIFIGIQTISFSQEEKNVKLKNNEVKVNFGMALLGVPEISYERILNNEYSAGISLAYSVLGKENIGTTYMITPHFRLFFGKKRAKGFFMEANASVFEERVYRYRGFYDYYSSYVVVNNTKYTNFGLGIGAGFKVISKSNWVGELYGGVGRNFLHNKNEGSSEYYPRIGFVAGRRF